MTRLPSILYHVWATRNGEAVQMGDPTPDFMEAFSEFLNCARAKEKPRAFCQTFDLDTNTPETFSEVTDEFETERETRRGEWKPNPYDRAHSERVADEIEILAAE